MSYTPGSSGSSGNWNNDAHGSARWMTRQETENLDMWQQHWDRGSILIGQNSNGRAAWLNQQGHVLVLAPPRSGKGVGFVLPNLIGYWGSMVVIDPKGENAACTHNIRRPMGHNVIVLDPTEKLASYGIDPPIPTHSFNPLEAFDNSNYVQVVDDIALVVDAILVSKDGEKEQHWRDGAKSFLTGILTYLIFFRPKNEHNLIVLSRIASGLETPLDDIFTALTYNGHPHAAISDVIAKSGAWWDKINVKERASFVSVALRSLTWLNSPVWHDHLTRSDFHPYDLKAGKTTVYIVCPFDKLEQYSPWFRLVLSCCIVAVLRAPKRSDIPTLFMLDEYAATIGRLAMLEHAIPYIEGTGGRFAMVFQYLSQMQKLWPNPEYHGIFASAGAHIFFNANDQNTSEYISNYIGKYGAKTPTPGGMSFVQRDVLTPDEVRTLPPGDLIAFLRGYRPAWLGKMNVNNEADLSRCLDPNPTYFVLPEAPKPTGQLSEGGPVLNFNSAMEQAKKRTVLSSGSVVASIVEKYPGKNFRFEGDLYGYDEPWTNPATGLSEMVFVPVIHASLLDTLMGG